MYGRSRAALDFPVLEIRRQAFPQQAKKIGIGMENRYLESCKTQNTGGVIPGLTGSCIVFSAHYDHLGRMGKRAFFPGANDNASGVSLLLDLARHFSSADEKPYYSVVFLFFSAEEVGLLGSKYYTEFPAFPLEKIKCLINLDLVGTGDDGIKVVNGSVYPEIFNPLDSLNRKNSYLEKVSSRGAAANSDHYFFHENGVPSVFIYTLGGIAEYHNIYDIAETLPLTGYKGLFRLLDGFVAYVSPKNY